DGVIGDAIDERLPGLLRLAERRRWNDERVVDGALNDATVGEGAALERAVGVGDLNVDRDRATRGVDSWADARDAAVELATIGDEVDGLARGDGVCLTRGDRGAGAH